LKTIFKPYHFRMQKVDILSNYQPFPRGDKNLDFILTHPRIWLFLCQNVPTCYSKTRKWNRKKRWQTQTKPVNISFWWKFCL